MRKIIRDYAIIFIDDNGETLSGDDYTTDNVIGEYYNHGGFLQWNFYLIIPEDLIPHDDVIEDFENTESYTRKLVIKRDKIDSFIKERFPEMKTEHGTMILTKCHDYENYLYKDNMNFNSTERTNMYSSWYRNVSIMDTLTEMDKLRAELINNPELHCEFFSHIGSEFSLAEKKFKLFLKK